MAQSILEILLRTIADTKGIDQTKSKLGELKGAAQTAGTASSELGSLLGIGLGVGALAAVTAVAGKFRELGEEELKNAQHIQDLTAKLSAQESVWGGLALSAGKFFDVVRIGLQMIPQIQQITNELRKAQATQLDFGSKVFDAFSKSLFSAIPGTGPQPFKEARDEMIKSLKDIQQNTLIQDAAILKLGEDSAKAWQQMKAGPVDVALDQVTQKLTALETKRAAIDPAKSVDSLKSYVATTQEIATWESRRLELEREQERLDRSGARGARIATEQQFTALMREQATVLQNIRQQQTLINENPFIGADAKNVSLLQTYTQELRALQGVMAALQAQKASGILDPVQLAQVNQKLQQTNFEIQLIGLKVVGLQQPMRTELANWVNQWGTASHQIAGLLQNVVGSSLQQLNHYLVTGQGNVKELLGHFAELGLTVVEQIAIQQAASLLGITTTTAASTAAAGTTATAWAPAAAATSVGSFGSSATIGAAAAIAAIAAIMAALVLHEGGEISSRRRVRRMHSGGLADDEVPIIAQQDEFMVQRDVVRQPGVLDFLLALNAGRMHQGGNIPAEWGDAPGWLINAWMNQPGGSLPPAADLDDPFGGFNPRFEGPQGPRVITPTDRSGRGGGWSRNERGIESAFAASMFGLSQGFGFGAFGPTLLPTFWNFHPGIGFVPMAVPVGGWQPEGGLNISTSRHSIVPKPEHTGGLISRLHNGGIVSSRFPRFHSGGGVGAGSPSSRMGDSGMSRDGAVNIYAFTDLKQLTRHMASRQGRNIIFDTIQGRRIDLGFPG